MFSLLCKGSIGFCRCCLGFLSAFCLRLAGRVEHWDLLRKHYPAGKVRRLRLRKQHLSSAWWLERPAPIICILIALETGLRIRPAPYAVAKRDQGVIGCRLAALHGGSARYWRFWQWLDCKATTLFKQSLWYVAGSSLLLFICEVMVHEASRCLMYKIYKTSFQHFGLAMAAYTNPDLSPKYWI